MWDKCFLKRIVGITALLGLLISTAGICHAANPVVAINEIQQEVYKQGNDILGKCVVVKGTISSGPNNQVTAKLIDPNGTALTLHQVTSLEGGEYIFRIPLYQTYPEGAYKVKVGGFDVMEIKEASFTYEKVESSAEFKTYKLDSNQGAISKTGNNQYRIDVTFPGGTQTADLRAMIAEFATEHATVKVGNVIQKSLNTINDFSSPVVYTVTSEDEATVNSYTVYATIRQSSTGPTGGGSHTTKVNVSPAIPYNNIESEPNLPTGFVDVPDNHWAKQFIEELARMKVIAGTEKSSTGGEKFEPDRNIKREEFVKMLVGAFKLEDQSATAHFTDVDSAQWYYFYIASAEEKGIISGVGDNCFGLGTLITRQDMAVMVYRAAKTAGITIPKKIDEKPFADADDIADYAKESISVMQQSDIISGMEDNRFVPNDTATRAQAAKIIFLLSEIGGNN